MLADQCAVTTARADYPQEARARHTHDRRRRPNPRPVVTPDIHRRIWRWKDLIAAAQIAGHIGKSCHHYLHKLLELPTVRAGGFCQASDETMAAWLNVKTVRTPKRHRDLAEALGLIEVDRTPGKVCWVRPRIPRFRAGMEAGERPDGEPVFLQAQSAPPAGQNCQGTYDNRVTRTSLKELLKEDIPPLPPLDGCSEGGGTIDGILEEKIIPPAPVAAAPAATMTFLEFWQAMGRTGSEGYARAQWGRLAPADRTAIKSTLARSRSWATDLWAGTWLKNRVWEEATPAPKKLVLVREGSPGWQAWLAHEGRKSFHVNKDGGRYCDSEFPPGIAGKEGK